MLVLFLLCSIVLSTPYTKNEKVQSFMNKAKAQKKRDMIYEVKDKVFDQKKFEVLAKVMGLKDEKILKTDTIVKVSSSKGDFLDYSENFKEYMYYSPTVLPLNKSDILDTSIYTSRISDFVVKNFNDGQHEYRLVSQNYELESDENHYEALRFITYRFVRYFNDRYIADMCDFISIRVGQSGGIAEIRHTESKFVPSGLCQKQLKPQMYDKYLSKEIDKISSATKNRVNVNLSGIASSDIDGFSVDSVNIVSAGNVYYKVLNNGTYYLKPCVDFHAIYNETGRKNGHKSSRITIPVSIDENDTIPESDVDSYSNSQCY